jgi:hypothetical protein
MSVWMRNNNRSEIPTYDNGDLFAIASGRIPGHQRIFVAGHNPSVELPGPEDVWPGGGTYAWKQAAGPMEIVSTSTSDAAAGAGARTVEIQGLDANYELLTQVVTLNGTTPVPIGSLLRVNSAVVRTAGASEMNVGTLNVRDVGGAAVVRMIVEAGFSRPAQAIYTVPAGKTLFILSGIAVCGEQGDVDDTLNVCLVRRANGVQITGPRFKISSGNGPWHLPLSIPSTVLEKTDLAIRARDPRQTAIDIQASIECLLIDNVELRW